MSRKQKRSIIDELFGGSLFSKSESQSKSTETGYSISVVHTPEGTKVKARAGKNTNANALKKQLRQQYPNAKIEIEGGSTKPLIREISAKLSNTKAKTKKTTRPTTNLCPYVCTKLS